MAAAEAKMLTMEEVRKHNTKEDCWVVMKANPQERSLVCSTVLLMEVQSEKLMATQMTEIR